MEGLSGRGRTADAFGSAAGSVLDATWSSRTSAMKRKPFRGNVLIRCCSSPLSPIAPRATFRRVVNAASETMRPCQMASMSSSLGDDARPVGDQVGKEIEDLGSDGNRRIPATQLTLVGIEKAISEAIPQANFLRQ